MRIVLASSSKFRKQALDLLDLDYEVIPSEIDESSIRYDDPETLVTKLAEAKARDVGNGLEGDNAIIAGDLFVLFQEEIYEKPETEGEALEMLVAFSGEELEVISSVSLFNTGTGELESALGKTRITFREVSRGEIENYIVNYPVLEFAGAFDREGVLKFASEVHGDLSFMTGMPLNGLIQLLRENGLYPGK